MPDAPRGRRLATVLARVGVAFLALPVVHFATRPLGGGDIYWQVRTGESILRTGALPEVDPYSYTVAGAAWNNHEWGYEVLVALWTRAVGLSGLRWMVLALAGGAVAGVAAVVARRASTAWGFAAASLFLLLSTYKFVPAPQTLSMALFLAAYWLFLREGLWASRARAAALIGWLMVWGNLTAEVLLFLPFLLADQVLRIAREDRGGNGTRVRGIVGLALACVAPLATPRSSSVLEYALVGSAVNRQVNGEFAHLWEPAETVPAAAKVIAGLLIAVYVTWAARRLRGSTDRLRDARPVACGLLAVAGAAAFERNLWLLAIPAVQLALAAARWARGAGREDTVDLGAVALGAVLTTACALGTGWSPALAWRHLTTPGYWSLAVDPGTVPVACGAALDRLPAGARVFTDRTWASYVIWRAPRVRVFIDGRNREYPLVLHRAATEAWEGGVHTLRILDVSGTDWVLATPSWGDLPNVRGGPWRTVARAGTCALYGRVGHGRAATDGVAGGLRADLGSYP